jgi:hypothetical protein
MLIDSMPLRSAFCRLHIRASPPRCSQMLSVLKGDSLTTSVYNIVSVPLPQTAAYVIKAQTPAILHRMRVQFNNYLIQKFFMGISMIVTRLKRLLYAHDSWCNHASDDAVKSSVDGCGNRECGMSGH